MDELFEALVMEHEGKMKQLTQALDEEIDNLRMLLENLEEDF